VWPRLDGLIDGFPVIVVDHGRPLTDRMKRERIDVEDVLHDARGSQGLERLDQVK
jgi:uncharacterized membrane protein YcaP (DUF421 family)